MWGHVVSCGCVICRTLPRIFSLISDNSFAPGWVPSVGNHLRLLESTLRDEVPAYQGDGPSPRFPRQLVGENTVSPRAPVLPPPLAPPPPQGEPFAEGEGKFNKTSQKPEGLSAKVPPAEPPAGITPKVKEEAETSSPKASQPGVAEVAEEKPDEKHKKKHKKEKSKRRSRTKSLERRKRRRSPSDSLDHSRASKARGKEGKARSEVPEPSEPPRRREEGSSVRGGENRSQGRGWVGPVPVSGHWRWSTAKNKGVTKRAKQEYFNRSSYRHRWRNGP